MTIASSIIAAASPQRDGRIDVHEIHTDSLGVPHYRFWKALAETDLSAALAAYALSIDAELTALEIKANIAQVLFSGSLAALSFDYSTAGQNRQALRDAYLISTRTEAVMIGDFLSSLTNAQLQTIFSMTAGQVTTLRTNKLTPAATLATSIRAAAGQ